MTRRQRARQLERRQQFNASFRNIGPNTISGPPPGYRFKLSAHGPGEPRGRFFRPLRRLANYVAHGEYLERSLARADTPGERESIQRALLAQITKVERTARRLSKETK